MNLITALDKLQSSLLRNYILLSGLEFGNEINDSNHCYGDDTTSIKSMKNKLMGLNDYLRFSDFLTDTLKAPKKWREGFPLHGSRPPIPQLEQMRQGKLAELDSKGTLSQSVMVTNEDEKKTEGAFIGGEKRAYHNQLREKANAEAEGKGYSNDKIDTGSIAKSQKSDHLDINFGMSDSDNDS